MIHRSAVPIVDSATSTGPTLTAFVAAWSRVEVLHPHEPGMPRAGSTACPAPAPARWTTVPGRLAPPRGHQADHDDLRDQQHRAHGNTLR